MVTTLATPRQLRELSKQLRAGGESEILKELRKAVRDAGKPVVEEVRNAWRTMSIRGDQKSLGVFAPTRGGGRKQRIEHATQRMSLRTAQRKYGGLRESVASATRLRNLSRGVTIEVDRSRFPAGWTNIAQDLESRRGWRHPVFGDKNTWVSEYGGPTFYPTCRRNQQTFHEAITSAMEAAKRKLEEKVRSA